MHYKQCKVHMQTGGSLKETNTTLMMRMLIAEWLLSVGLTNTGSGDSCVHVKH